LLFFGAFSAVPEIEMSSDCFSNEIADECYKTFLIFMLGYVSTLAAKRRHLWAKRLGTLMRAAVDRMSATSLWMSSTTSNLTQPSWFNKDVLAIVLVAALFSICLIGLIVSAFMAEVDTDAAEAGLASESSTTMRVFTVGWMFVLSFKLRRELIGAIGSCCLLQPW
jgi:hypothetical protein